MQGRLFGAIAACAALGFAAAGAPRPGTAGNPPVAIGDAFEYRTSHGRTLRMTLAGLSLRESWTDLESAAGYSVERILPDGTLAGCSKASLPLE